MQKASHFASMHLPASLRMRPILPAMQHQPTGTMVQRNDGQNFPVGYAAQNNEQEFKWPTGLRILCAF
eukprot:3598488-Amphidinium_carterae.1